MLSYDITGIWSTSGCSRWNGNFIFSPTVSASSPLATWQIVLLVVGGILLGIVCVITIFVNKCRWKNQLFGELAPHLTFHNLTTHSREGDTLLWEIFYRCKILEDAVFTSEEIFIAFIYTLDWMGQLIGPFYVSWLSALHMSRNFEKHWPGCQVPSGMAFLHQE